MSSKCKQHEQIFNSILKDQCGKPYSSAERAAVSKRWYSKKGSAVPTREEAEKFMAEVMKRKPSSSTSRTTTAKKPSLRRPKTKKKSVPIEQPIKAADAEAEGEGEEHGFIFSENPMETYVPGSTKKEATKEKFIPLKKENTIASDAEAFGIVHDDKEFIKSFKSTVLNEVTKNYKDDPQHPKNVFIFVPSTKQLSEDMKKRLNPKTEEYINAHIGHMYPRSKRGIIDLHTNNDRDWTIRAQSIGSTDETAKMTLTDKQPFGGKYAIEKVDAAEKIDGFKNLHVTYVYLAKNAGSLL